MEIVSFTCLKVIPDLEHEKRTCSKFKSSLSELQLVTKCNHIATFGHIPNKLFQCSKMYVSCVTRGQSIGICSLLYHRPRYVETYGAH
jgi:hypothetical protein